MLQIENLTKSYFDGGRQIPVLRELNLRVEGARSVAIMGPSGCGKSTLISCLAGLSSSDEGKIQILGRQMERASIEEWARFRADNIGIVFQQFHLVPYLTAVENVRLPLDLNGGEPERSQESSLQSLGEVGLRERASHFPHRLSRGECQRVAIARVMVTHPKLLLADEPTASLDRVTGRSVVNQLVGLSKKLSATLIMVTHDHEMAASCDEILHFVDGKLRSQA